MRFSGLISVITFTLFLSSCYPGLKGGVRYSESPFAKGEKIMLYDTLPSVSTFDFVLSHKGKDVSGMLIIVVSESNHRRIIMTTHFGMTLMDFELTESALKLNYSIEQLNRKRILNLLKRDFETLFNPYAGRGVKFLFGSESRINALKRGRGITATIMKFSDFSDGYPNQIFMDHPGLKLSIKLEKTNYLSNE